MLRQAPMTMLLQAIKNASRLHQRLESAETGGWRHLNNGEDQVSYE